MTATINPLSRVDVEQGEPVLQRLRQKPQRME